MALTRDFRETVRAHAQRDPKFRIVFLEAAIERVVDGVLDGAKAFLANIQMRRCDSGSSIE